ncbi:MAG: geranylgeranyl reductase family protein [Salibacteraceae bacterium]
MTKFDVAIVGAGPAGASTAIALHGSSLKVALIDKATFPRDKICGDALSPDVVNQLRKLPLNCGELFDQFEQKIWCNAVRFVAPNYRFADLRLNKPGITGYVSPRLDFDYFLYQQAVRSKVVTDFTGNTIAKLEKDSTGVRIQINDETIHADVVLAADGANSFVSRTLHNEKIDRNHHCAGLRCYYENVSGFSPDNAVELHFYKELLPGYFWIFPLPGNRANVGLGMLSAYVSKKNVNLKQLLQQIIKDHPNVKDRFAQARATEEIKGFGLPLGSKKRNLSGDRYLMLGDAASLINPLSGEGIGNAIRSGRVAAEHIKLAVQKQRFDATFNKAYDKEIYHRMWGELRMNYWIQLAMRNPRLSNFIVEKAVGSKMIESLVLSGFSATNLFK